MATEQIETLIIGGGQAGLTMSHMLSKRGRPHLILERHGIAKRWRSEHWDGLCLQSPHWHNNLPDFPFPHTDPDGYGTAAEVYNFLTAYAAFIDPPIRCGVEVTALRRRQDAAGFVAETIAALLLQVARTRQAMTMGPESIVPAIGISRSPVA
jgi:putative flavoprotein involved in K+ transport